MSAKELESTISLTAVMFSPYSILSHKWPSANQPTNSIAEICHEIVEDGYRLGMVTDAEMKEFEKDSFVSEPEPVHEVKSTIAMKHAIA